MCTLNPEDRVSQPQNRNLACKEDTTTPCESKQLVKEQAASKLKRSVNRIKRTAKDRARNQLIKHANQERRSKPSNNHLEAGNPPKNKNGSANTSPLHGPPPTQKEKTNLWNHRNNKAASLCPHHRNQVHSPGPSTCKPISISELWVRQQETRSRNAGKHNASNNPAAKKETLCKKLNRG